MPAVYLEGKLSTVKEVRLSKESWNWVSDDGTAVVTPVDQTPLILFEQPSAANIETGQLVTVDDQILIIDSVGCTLEEWNGDRVVLRLGEKELRVPWDQVRSLRFPK